MTPLRQRMLEIEPTVRFDRACQLAIVIHVCDALALILKLRRTEFVPTIIFAVVLV